MGSNLTGAMDVLSGRGLCDELITRPEESYRLYCSDYEGYCLLQCDAAQFDAHVTAPMKMGAVGFIETSVLCVARIRS